MNKKTFEYQSTIEAPVEEAFQWHTREGAFQRLNPPWENVQLVKREGTIRDGDRAVLQIKTGPIKTHWVAEHFDFEENRQFKDRQVEGPFAHWEHTHRFEPIDENRFTMIDHIEYELPMGELGERLGKYFIENRMERMMAYRHRILQNDLKVHRKNPGKKSLKIAISGSRGLLGSNLTAFLTTGGHQVYRLVRNPDEKGPASIYWNPAEHKVQSDALEGLDAVIHLAGENIADRWTEEKKQRIRDSRVEGTRLLSEALSSLKQPPKTFISASAIGYYGDRNEEVLTEDSSPGTGFLPNVGREWERATQAAKDNGIRVANLRIGIVLTPQGGALSRMLLPFRMGGGGRLGSGKQYMSWIAIDDLLYAFHHLLITGTLDGPINGTAPNPVTNQEFTKTLARVLNRPAWIPMPEIAVKTMFGEMGEALLLASARVNPERLKQTGFEFFNPELEDALRHELGYTRKE